MDGVKSQAAGSGIAPHRVILKTNGGFFPASGTAEVELYKAHESLIGGGDLETPYYDGDHHLSGWTRDGSPVTVPLKIDDPMTLIAQWEKNPPADTGTGGGTGSGSTGGVGAGTGTGAGGTGAGTGTGTGGGTGSGSTGGAGAGTGTGAGGTGTGTGTGTGNGTGTGTGASTYTVTYDKNKAGSGTAPQGQTKLAGSSLILQGNSGNLARDGYTFNGWNTSADGTGDSYQEGAAYTKDESVTLYAKWIMEGGGLRDKVRAGRRQQRCGQPGKLQRGDSDNHVETRHQDRLHLQRLGEGWFSNHRNRQGFDRTHHPHRSVDGK